MLRSTMLFLSLFSVSVTSSAGSGDELAWQFKVYLDDKPIGYHDFRISEEGETRRVDIEARFDVKVLFVNLYRYRHQTVETWRNDCLMGIDSVTDANGRSFVVNGAVENAGFALSNGDASTTLPECVMSFAYWNPAFLEADRLLNSQTGDYEAVSITRIGEETLNVAGQTLPAVRYRVDSAAGAITLWYHQLDYRWLALTSPAAGDRTLRYEAVLLPDVLPQLAER